MAALPAIGGYYALKGASFIHDGAKTAAKPSELGFEDWCLVTCNMGHVVERYRTRGPGWSCNSPPNGCGKVVPDNYQMYSCRPCKFDLCEDCFWERQEEEERILAFEEAERKSKIGSSDNAQVLGKAESHDQNDECSKLVVDDDVSTTASTTPSSSLPDIDDVRRRCSLKRLCRFFL